MAKAKVLYIHVTGVSSEILKNLVLAGIQATICDHRKFPDAVLDTPSFLVPPSKTMTRTTTTTATATATEKEPNAKKRAKTYDTVGQALKPAVEELNLLLGECPVLDKHVEDLDETLVQQYPIVIASRIGMEQAQRLANMVAKAGHQFYLVDCFGLDGASAIDLGPNFTFRPEKGKQLLDPEPLASYIPMKDVFDTPLEQAVNRFHKTAPPAAWMKYRAILEYHQQTRTWPTAENAEDFATKIQSWIQTTSPKLASQDVFQPEALQNLAKVALAETAPVCAVLAGHIGNEVIKAISGKGKPANNTLLFEGDTCKCWSFLVKAKEENKA